MKLPNVAELSDDVLAQLMAIVSDEQKARRGYYFTAQDREKADLHIRAIAAALKSLDDMGYRVWHSPLDDSLYVTRNTVTLNYAPKTPLDSEKVMHEIPSGVRVVSLGCDDYQFVPLCDGDVPANERESRGRAGKTPASNIQWTSTNGGNHE